MNKALEMTFWVVVASLIMTFGFALSHSLSEPKPQTAVIQSVGAPVPAVGHVESLELNTTCGMQGTEPCR